MMATSLMNPYINNEDCMNKLIERKEFLNSAILAVAADMTMELGKINQHNVSKEIKDELFKSIRKKREIIKVILKEPAHHFNDKLLLDKND
jgi:hypothetical protein